MLTNTTKNLQTKSCYVCCPEESICFHAFLSQLHHVDVTKHNEQKTSSFFFKVSEIQFCEYSTSHELLVLEIQEPSVDKGCDLLESITPNRDFLE